MNVIEIDAASNNGVDNIREIREEVQYSPTEGKYKVYIIDEVHMLSIGAFNALLKTLEEPPEYVIFILATTEAHKIPITILSRCQRYDFRRISIETIAGRLSQLMKAENINVEEKAIRYVAKAADGSMRDALSLLDQCIAFYLGKDLTYDNVLEVLGAVDTEVFARMLKFVVEADTYGCMQLLEELVMQGRDLGQFVSDFVWYLRNLLLIQTSDDAKIEDIIDVSTDNLAQLKSDAKLADADTLMRYIRVMSELANDLKFSTQKRIKVEIALIKLTRPAMEQRADLSEMLSRIALLEQSVNDTKEQLKSGTFTVQKSQNTGRESQENTHENAKVQKRVIQALPDDIKQLAAQWDSVVHSMDDPLSRTHLLSSHVTLAEDGQSLELMFHSLSAYNYFAREEQKQQLVQLIEERTGLTVNLIVTKLEDAQDFQNRFTDIRESVNMDIEVDDKEEFI
jgi:DNA polymerase-3 subunit gamma/tau